MVTSILGVATATDAQACYHALDKGAELWFACLAATYWRYAPGMGVRPEVAYAQACHETGYGRFGRAVTRAHHNYCGLKVTAPTGADDNPDAHMSFPTPEVGVLAHLEHLALYAGAPGFPRSSPVDTRHFAFLAGTATTVEALSTRWAPSSEYHRNIVAIVAAIQARVE